MQAARARKRWAMRSVMPARVRAPWRSRVRMSLQVCKDRLDPLPDRGQVRPGVGLASTGRTHDGCPKAVHFGGELATGIGLVADEGQACGSLKAPDHLQRHLAIVAI